MDRFEALRNAAAKGKSLHGEYPIKGWHGVNQCRYLRMNLSRPINRLFMRGTLTKRMLAVIHFRTEALQMPR